MTASLQRICLQFGVILWAMGVAAAQNPAKEMVPDVPAAADSGSPVAPVANETRQVRQEYAIGMTAREKYTLAYRRIVSPQMPFKAALISGWELGTGTGADFPTNGWAPFARRYGYNAASISTTIFFNTAVVPALVHQDPRYFPLHHGPVKTRVRWALRSEFVGVGDDGRAMPNYANLVGLALSSIAENGFSPRESVGYGDTAKRYVIKIGVGMGLNLVREFDIFERVRALAQHSKSAGE